MIITHPMREPIDKLMEGALFWLVMLAAKVGMDHLFKRKPDVKPHQGGKPLLPDFTVEKRQPALAAAIQWASGPGAKHGSDAATFIQKIREWTDYNRSRNKADPRPYFTYEKLCRKHFGGHNFASMQRLVKSLEAWKNEKKKEPGLGLLITERDMEHNRCKRYAVDEQAVDALIARWEAACPDQAKSLRESWSSARESSRLADKSSGIGRESSGLERESYKSSNQLNKRNSESQGARGAVRSLTEIALTATDSHSHTEEIESGDFEKSVSVNAEISTEDRTDTSLPSSEAPLSPIDTGVNDRISDKSNMTFQEVWNTAHHQLSLLFDRPSFDMWLKDAVLLRSARMDDEGMYAVGVRTEHAREMLQHRYYRNIQRVVEGLHNQPVKIHFEVYTPPERPVEPYPADLLRLIPRQRAAERRT